MFRPLRRSTKAISVEAAKELLKTARCGVFAVNGDDGYPYAVPVNYYYDESCGKIFFHGAKAGYKFDCLKQSDKICFTVYGSETFKEGEWAPYVQSVVVFGRCALIDDELVTLARVRQVAEKYYPSDEEIDAEINKCIRAAQLYEITIEHMCGKQIQEK